MRASLEGVVDVTRFPGRAGGRQLLIEVPHGATQQAHYDAVFARLKSPLPAQLEHFFFVNTDIGAPEGALLLGRELSAQGVGVVVARCLIPRTFIDTNRVVAKTEPGVVKDGLTPAVASYVTDPDDVAWLDARHAEYTGLARALYREVVGDGGGLALQLHSFAPRSVGIERTDENIVNALHAAYEPQVYATWPERPPVDLITALADGSFRAAPRLVDATLAAFHADGIEAKENATYHLHPVTMGTVHARDYPDSVLCVELNRGLVADPFVPFGVSPISEEKVRRLVRPLLRVFAAELGA